MHMTITTFLATYGALLASVGLGWNLLRDLRDSVNIKLDVSLKKLAQAADGRPYAVALELPTENTSPEVFIHFNIVNVGRRRARIVGLGGNYRLPEKGNKNFLVIPHNLPVLLEEGQDTYEMFKDFGLVSDNVKRLFVWDTTGRYWYVGWWNLRKVREEAKKYVQNTGEHS